MDESPDSPSEGEDEEDYPELEQDDDGDDDDDDDEDDDEEVRTNFTGIVKCYCELFHGVVETLCACVLLKKALWDLLSLGI